MDKSAWALAGVVMGWFVSSLFSEVYGGGVLHVKKSASWRILFLNRRSNPAMIPNFPVGRPWAEKQGGSLT